MSINYIYKLIIIQLFLVTWEVTWESTNSKDIDRVLISDPIIIFLYCSS